MNVLVVADESAGAEALRVVAERGHRVVGVLAGPAGAPVVRVAARLGIECGDSARVGEARFARDVATQGVDLLLNVYSQRIVHAAVVAAPRIGSFNLHPGPLPRYAGLNVQSWAIYEGETRHAVTLHWMEPEVDAGPVAYESWFAIAPDDTAVRVAANCVRRGIPLVERLLDDAAGGAGRIPRTPQDLAVRRWHGRGTPHGGRLPWDLPARRVVDLVRAASYAPFASPWCCPTATLDGREIGVLRASHGGGPAGEPPGSVGEARPGGVLVAAGDDWVLVERLRCDGRPAEPAAVLASGGRFDAEPAGPGALPRRRAAAGRSERC